MKHRRQLTTLDLEVRTELLRERIYATLALLAVLLTIDTAHTSSRRAALAIGGTALSLWAASLTASRVSYRIVKQHDPDGAEVEQQITRHWPLIQAAIFPLFMVGLAAIGLFTLTTAINLAMGFSLLLLLGWSLLSARALRAGGIVTLILAGTEVAIGLAIVGLKIVASH